MSKLKLVGLSVLYFITGMIACRGGQHMVIQGFNARYEACIQRELDANGGQMGIEKLFQCQAEAMPSKLVIKIFFW